MHKLNPGTIVDKKFEIISELGAGGMGTVYKARQISFVRDVAIKVLHDITFVDDDESFKRFEREAKALSLLSHVNITQFLDYGVWLDKVPYIAMEFVEADTLRKVLNTQNRLSWKRALELASQLAEALAYCHAAGIIHRDIKPENIFILTSGGIKLADFGLAKIQSHDGKSTLTKTGSLIGSPYYMSPELGKGAPADARSDIYSLGCVIFEMLSGSRPIDADSSMALMARKNLEPAQALSVFLDTSSIPQEIEALLARILERDPSNRIQTAEELKTTLDSILKNHASWTDKLPNLISPVQATRMKGRSGRLALLVSAALILFLAPGFLYLSQKKTRKTSKVNRVPSVSLEKQGKADSTEESLKRKIAQIEKRHSEDHEALFEASFSLANHYCLKQDYGNAERYFRKALQIAAKNPNNKFENTTDILLKLATCRSKASDYLEAESLYKQALKRSEDSEQITQIVASLAGLAEINTKLQHRSKETEKILLKAIKISSKDPIYGDQLRLAQNAMANMKIQTGHLAEAEPYLIDVIKYTTAKFGPKHLDTLLSKRQLANLYSEEHKFKQAEECYKEVLSSLPSNGSQMEKQVLHAITTADYAKMCSEAVQTEKALALYTQALSEYAQTSGPESAEYAILLVNCAKAYEKAKRYEEAEKFLKQALSINNGQLLPSVLAIQELTKMLQEQNKPEAAKLCLARTISANKKLHGNSEYVTHLQIHLASIYLKENNFKEALPLLEEAYAAGQKLYKSDQTSMANICWALGNTYFALGRSREAETVLKQGYEIDKKLLGEHDPRTKSVRDILNRISQQH